MHPHISIIVLVWGRLAGLRRVEFQQQSAGMAEAASDSCEVNAISAPNAGDSPLPAASNRHHLVFP
jgi:hypothetical protein